MTSPKLVLIDREALLSELQQVFDEQTAHTLLRVLDRVADQAHSAGVTRTDFGELSRIVAALAEAQQRTEEQIRGLAEVQRRSEERLSGVEERLKRLEQTVAALAEAQRRSEERLSKVEERLSGVEERLTRLEETVAALAEAQRHSEERLSRVEERLSGVEDHLRRLETNVASLVEQIEALTRSQQGTIDTVGDLKGKMLELTYRHKVHAYFGILLRRPEVVDLNSVWDTLEEHLLPGELNEVLATDLLVRGRPRQAPAGQELWLAIEVSGVVDRRDVERARRRAELLRRAGYQALPMVAGEDSTDGARREALQYAVAMLQDGRTDLWDEAYTTWVT